jgi:hypothetical protein
MLVHVIRSLHDAGLSPYVTFSNIANCEKALGNIYLVKNAKVHYSLHNSFACDHTLIHILKQEYPEKHIMPTKILYPFLVSPTTAI